MACQVNCQIEVRCARDRHVETSLGPRDVYCLKVEPMGPNLMLAVESLLSAPAPTLKHKQGLETTYSR